MHSDALSFRRLLNCLFFHGDPLHLPGLVDCCVLIVVQVVRGDKFRLVWCLLQTRPWNIQRRQRLSLLLRIHNFVLFVPVIVHS